MSANLLNAILTHPALALATVATLALVGLPALALRAAWSPRRSLRGNAIEAAGILRDAAREMAGLAWTALTVK